MSEEYFTKHARSNDALGAICKECQAKHRRIPEVKQRLKEQFYKYTKTDKYRSYQREYHNRPARKAHRRKYHANRSHLPKVRQQRRRTLMKYRTTKKQLSDTFTSDQEHRMYEYWNNQCAVCKVNFDMFITAQPDHWIPLSNEMSLGTVVENMIPLCSNRHGLVSHTACNQSKSGKDPKQWLIEKYGNKEGLRIYQEVMDYFEWAKKQSKRK